MAIDEDRLNDFVGRFAGDLGAVLHAATVLIGDRLGLYAAMGDSQPVTAAQLAERTGYDERYLREWLSAQAASGYAEYDATAETFRLTEEQAFTLTSPDNPFFAPGGMQVAASTIADVALVADAVRTGGRRRLGCTRRQPVRRHRPLLPAQLHRQSGRLVAAGARRRRRRAGDGCPGGRHRMRLRILDHL